MNHYNDEAAHFMGWKMVAVCAQNWLRYIHYLHHLNAIGPSLRRMRIFLCSKGCTDRHFDLITKSKMTSQICTSLRALEPKPDLQWIRKILNTNSQLVWVCHSYKYWALTDTTPTPRTISHNTIDVIKLWFHCSAGDFIWWPKEEKPTDILPNSHLIDQIKTLLDSIRPSK